MKFLKALAEIALAALIAVTAAEAMGGAADDGDPDKICRAVAEANRKERSNG